MYSIMRRSHCERFLYVFLYVFSVFQSDIIRNNVRDKNVYLYAVDDISC